MDAVTKELHRAQRAVRSGRISQNALARRARLSETVLTNMLSAGWNPLASTLAAVVRALDSLDRQTRSQDDRLARKRANRPRRRCS